MLHLSLVSVFSGDKREDDKKIVPFSQLLECEQVSGFGIVH